MAADLLDSVNVVANDRTVPLSQVAQISVRDAQTLWVAIFDPQVRVPLARTSLATTTQGTTAGRLTCASGGLGENSCWSLPRPRSATRASG